MSDFRIKFPVFEGPPMLNELGVPVEAPEDYILADRERQTVKTFLSRVEGLFRGTHTHEQSMYIRDAHTLPLETLHETIVHNMGIMLGADVDAGLTAAIEVKGMYMTAEDFEKLGLAPRERPTPTVIRAVSLKIQTGSFGIYEAEFPEDPATPLDDNETKWYRIFKVYKLPEQAK